MNDEPKWRQVLCWGAVATFLTLPLLVFGLAFFSHELGWTKFWEHAKEYSFVGRFYQSVTALIFGLSGLNSLDRFKNGKGTPQK